MPSTKHLSIQEMFSYIYIIYYNKKNYFLLIYNLCGIIVSIKQHSVIVSGGLSCKYSCGIMLASFKSINNVDSTMKLTFLKQFQIYI